MGFFDTAIYKGGFLLMVAGGAARMASYWLIDIFHFLINQFVVSVEVQKSQADSYKWIMDYLANNSSHILTTQKLSVSVHQTLSWQSKQKKHYAGEVVTQERPKLKYLPGSGMHILWYHGTFIFVWRSVTRLQINKDVHGHRGDTTRESLTLMSIGRNKRAIESLVKEAMNISFDKDKGQTIMYSIDNGLWARTCSRESRDMSSVLLDGDTAEKIIADARDFLASGDWYRSLGIPYRRTFLLYGPPGCGKTSFISAMAAQLGLDVSVVSLGKESLDDSSINMYLSESPMNSIIVLEDVDAAFPSREELAKEERTRASKPWWYSTSRVTFSGLINAIDGIASQEGRIFVMTTNHKKKLDPALLRPGRVDYSAYFGLASHSQLRRLFLRFYPDEPDLAQKFAEKIGEKKASMALVQGFFLAHRSDALKAYNEAPRLLEHIENEALARKKRKELMRKEQEEQEAEENVAGILQAMLEDKDEEKDTEKEQEKDKDELPGKGKEKEEPLVDLDNSNQATTTTTD